MNFLDEYAPELQDEFQSVRTQIREAELVEANRIRCLYWIKWLGTGDEPYKLFFVLLKAKQLREAMNTLITDAKLIITDKEEILQEITRFYCNLFESTGNGEEAQLVRRELLCFTTTRVTEDQCQEMEREPTSNKIRKILKEMPRGKSPSLDRMTVEVLSTCWNFLGQDCLHMIKHFWSTGFLPKNFTSGVMKVIPKKADKRRLKDWRSLTMLTIIYKMIAALLAGRLNPVNTTLISPQQIGFIIGWSILENISLA